MARIILPAALPAPKGYDDEMMMELLDSMGHNGRAVIAALNGDIYCNVSDVEAWNDAVKLINKEMEEEEEE